MNKKISFIILFTYFFIFSIKCRAYVSFQDDFSNRDDVNWNYQEKSGSIVFNNGAVSLSSFSSSFPLMHRVSNGGIFSNNADSVLEVKFKYDRIYYNGSGIGIGFTGIDGMPYYQFEIWADNTGELGGIAFMHNNFNRQTYGYCSNFYDQNLSSERNIVKLTNDFAWHILRIEHLGNIYSVYFDKDSNPNPIFVTEANDCNPTNILFGNPLGGGSNWSFLTVDYLKSSEILVPQTKPKIIFLPGFGASWNTEAMVSGKTGDNIVWKMTPFVHNYDRLIQGFKDNGLKENEDYYVFNYDWRRQISETVDNLNKFIDLKIKSGDKVDLVGHSMGGVVSRIWAQDHFGDARLDLVVAMASPQMGTLEAYTAWNGVNLGGSVNYYDVALNIVSLLNKGKSVRVFSPALKDLFPIFDFIKINGQKKSFTNLTFVNNYLLSKILVLLAYFRR